MRAEDRHALAVPQVKHADGIIVGCRYNLLALAVGVKGDRADYVGVVAEAVRAEATDDVPHADRAICGAGDD
jgi:hypothetical protein